MSKKNTNKFKDSDADGLSDQDEINLGTNPNKADSDDDGVNDYAEVYLYGTDPLNPDTDGDGIKDGDEIKGGRNPKGPGFLEDLFIPGIHNNFKPQALHPKRILFYSLSAVLFKAILVITVMALPIEAWLTPNILEEQSRQVISLTNTIRKNLNLALLNESQRLDQAAFSKASDMLVNQYFSHTGPDNKTLADWLSGIKYNFTTAGENLAMGFSSPEEVVNGWTRSRTHYQNMIDPDFKEIGVGMVSGLYDSVDTTLVAQYFGAPAPVLAAAETSTPAPVVSNVEPPAVSEVVRPSSPPAEPPVVSTTKPPVVSNVEPVIGPSQMATTTASSTQLLGKKVNDTAQPDAAPPVVSTTEPPATSANEPPVVSPVELPKVDLTKSKLYVDQAQGQAQSIVRAEVYLSPSTAKAQVNFNNYFINLQPSVVAAGLWTGQTIIFKEGQEQIFNPVVLASLTAENRAGEKITVDLPWNNIKPANTTLLKQYYFIKQHQSPYIAPLYDVTSIFYKIILLMALIALGLNTFIHIKKQRPRVILSTLGLIALLVILIII